MIAYDDELRERLRTNLAAFEPRDHPLGGRRHAAVSVIVLDSDAETHGVDTTWWELPEEERGNRLDMVPGLPDDPRIVDSTGASILDKSFAAIRPLGHVVSYGEAEGKPYDTLWEQLVRKSLTFTRLHIGHLDYTSDTWRDATKTVLGMIRDGKLRMPIKGIYPMEDVADMFAALASRQTAGKLLLQIG